jgi:hypothetical protein
MTQTPDDTPDSLVSLDADEIQDEEVATPEETNRSFHQGGHDDDPGSYLNM